jgi:hypothetical protein
VAAEINIDRALRDLIAGHDSDLCALLCTMARLGVHWRNHEPERCSWWIGQLGMHPYYKGGQFLFDLLEWEDFLLDGEQRVVAYADILAFVEAVPVLRRLLPEHLAFPSELPPLETGFYLYRDVVLGVLWITLSAAEARSGA